MAIMPQEVAILSNQVLKEAVKGWNYSKKTMLQWDHVKIRLAMQKQNIVFFIIYIRYWNDGARDDSKKNQ